MRSVVVSVLPPSLPPRGLSRVQAAEYLGISCSLFDRLIRDGLMPKAKKLGGRVVWDRLALDRAFSQIDAESGDNPLDGVL